MNEFLSDLFGGLAVLALFFAPLIVGPVFMVIVDVIFGKVKKWF